MAETKLVWNQENIKDVAESVGIEKLNEESVKVLSQEVEYRVGQVIIEAMRFMHAGKRTTLGTQDISQALKVLDVEPLYGYESTRPLRFGEASLGPGQPLFYIEDEEVDFEKLINAPLPKVPRDVSFTAHWLAVEGVQPSIPQNPTTAEARANELVPRGPGANQTLAALAGNDNVTFKPLVKHVLSRELVLFFEKIKSALLDDGQDPEVIVLRKSALESVRSDTGLHQLVPYFVQFVAEKVTHSLKNLFVLQQMMELTQAITENKTLFIEPYIASLVPPILTCLLGRTLGADGLDNLKEQYQLRDLAASLIGHISNKYSKSSGELQARLARTCLKYFLDPTRSLAEHYGAINGITLIGGSAAILTLVLPNLKPFEYVLAKAQNERGANDESLRMLIGVIMKGIMSITEMPTLLTNGMNGNAAEGQEVEEYLGATIGSRVAALGNHKLNKAILDSREKH
ncbi:related to TATA-binding protein-associated-factor [Phialocephala subalpina]|uniref:TBP-associated factor 6 n=1 Tax=Phialocephala subalpina TaxID=576137 RepID=A0A1L7WUJ3_9HELO|nr:related to TATA-binding protein-associated-factor [Phialocephala subalpina]